MAAQTITETLSYLFSSNVITHLIIFVSNRRCVVTDVVAVAVAVAVADAVFTIAILDIDLLVAIVVVTVVVVVVFIAAFFSFDKTTTVVTQGSYLIDNFGNDNRLFEF